MSRKLLPRTALNRWSPDGDLALSIDLTAEEDSKWRAAAKRRGIAPDLLLKRLVLCKLSEDDTHALRLEVGDDLIFYIIDTVGAQLDRSKPGET